MKKQIVILLIGLAGLAGCAPAKKGPDFQKWEEPQVQYDKNGGPLDSELKLQCRIVKEYAINVQTYLQVIETREGTFLDIYEFVRSPDGGEANILPRMNKHIHFTSTFLEDGSKAFELRDAGTNEILTRITQKRSQAVNEGPLDTADIPLNKVMECK